MGKRYDTVGIWPLDEAAARYSEAMGGISLAPLLHLGFAQHRLKTVIWQGQPYTSTHWITEFVQAALHEQEGVNPASGPTSAPPHASQDEDEAAGDEDILTLGDFHEEALDINDAPLRLDDDPLSETDSASDADTSDSAGQDDDARPGGVVGDFSYTIQEGRATGSADHTFAMVAWLKGDHPGLSWLVERWRVDGVGSADIAQEAGVSESTITRYFQTAQDIYAQELHRVRKHAWGETKEQPAALSSVPITRRAQNNEGTRAHILAAIDALTHDLQRAPTFGELLAQLGWTSRRKLQNHLKALLDDGRVVNRRGWTRA